ncbi:neutral amino acid transporter [Entomortierella beljakovae]|nr:neutral amino acid transporter [Entomortierella beljakovae]
MERSPTFNIEPAHYLDQPQPGRQSNFNPKNTKSGSRATSRSRQSGQGSRPVSWLKSANSDYTSIYDNYGGTRSRRNSNVDENANSVAEKGMQTKISSKPSISSDGESERDREKHNARTTRPGIGPQPLSRTGTFISEDCRAVGPNDEQRKGNVSALKACLLLGKAFVGTGVLFLPKAFMNGVQVRFIVKETFQDMGLVLYGKYMRLAVLLSVALSQVGFVCAYMIFISQNINAIVETFSKCKFHGITEKYYILIPLVVLIPLVLIRRMAILSLPSMFANVFIIFGITYLWYYSINNLVHNGFGPEIVLFNRNDFALFIGTAVFSFEGIGLIIPITESMAEPEKFPRVLAITITIVSMIFCSVGALCYSSFGNKIQTIVLLNLPVDEGMTITVEIIYTCAIILSVPLMLSPASRIMENSIFGDKSGGQYPKTKIQKNMLRIGLICTCAFVSFSIGGLNLDKFVSFVGSVACIPLCFIFPALFHYKACAKTVKEKLLDILLGIFGVIVMVFTMYITIRSWVAVDNTEVHFNRCASFA